MTPQEQFLTQAFAAAKASGHIFPDYAACETALESAWGQSQLCQQANNLFGEKQTHPPVYDTLALPTREFLHGTWVSVTAQWIKFPDWASAFQLRMQTLQRLQNSIPSYKLALTATDGVHFVQYVSQAWSTDPDRAGKVLTIHDHHQDVFAAGSSVSGTVAGG